MKLYQSISKRIVRYLKICHQKQIQGHHSVIRQLIEMALLAMVRRIGPGYYLLAGFYRRNLSWQEKCNHLNGSEYQKLIKTINPIQYHKLSQNKISEKGILQLMSVRTPRFLGYLKRQVVITMSGEQLSDSNQLHQFLSEFSEKKICFKPVEGWAGRGIRVADVVNNNGSLEIKFIDESKSVAIEMAFDQYLYADSFSAYIIEEFLEQHPTMASFNPSSVNTLRLWVLQNDDSLPRVILGYLRIGREGAFVDNQSSGGIVAPINLENGELGIAINGTPDREEYPVHPDHGAIIEGCVLPFFEEAKALAIHCLMVFPQVRFAGMDVAIQKTGPAIIEMNVNPDRIGAAFVDAQTKKLFSDIH